MAASGEFKARVGDRLHMHSRKRLGGTREGEIIEVRGTPEKEYYLVRWPNDRESLIHPGPGVTIPEVDARVRAEARRKAREDPPPAPAEPEPATGEKEPKFELHRAVESSLTAAAGDRLVIRSRRLDGSERDAEILEVLGEDGHPPYRVRWSDTGRETITRPGSDAYVDHLNQKTT